MDAEAVLHVTLQMFNCQNSAADQGVTVIETLLELTVLPPVPGAEATAPNVVGAGVGLNVPTTNACPVHVVVVVLVTPVSVWLLGSVKVQVAVVLTSVPLGWAVAVRQNGVPTTAL